MPRLIVNPFHESESTPLRQSTVAESKPALCALTSPDFAPLPERTTPFSTRVVCELAIRDANVVLPRRTRIRLAFLSLRLVASFASAFRAAIRSYIRLETASQIALPRMPYGNSPDAGGSMRPDCVRAQTRIGRTYNLRNAGQILRSASAAGNPRRGQMRKRQRGRRANLS